MVEKNNHILVVSTGDDKNKWSLRLLQTHWATPECQPILHIKAEDSELG